MEHDKINHLMVSSVSDAHPETLDFLSNAWCNFAVQALQPPQLFDQSSILVRDNTMKMMSFDTDMASPGMVKMESSPSMDGAEYGKPTPPWKSNDVKSWIWMQQAMHPDVNYNAGFGKKWSQWKTPFGKVSIKKWVKEMKEKRKENKRLQRAEVHAAVSIAGLAAALAAVAKETSKGQLELEPELIQARKAALAQASALVASQCAQMAKSIGAKRDQLSSVIGSALSATCTSDILTFTAAANTSLRGAATLKARGGCKNILNGTPILPIEMESDDDFNFEKCRLLLAKGALLAIQTPDGKCTLRLVSLHLNNETKVMLRIMKRNMLNVITSKKECLVLDLQAELYKDSEVDNEYATCYQIVLVTTKGTMKLDMARDYQRYKMWATTIDQMLKLSPSLARYQLQFCKY